MKSVEFLPVSLKWQRRMTVGDYHRMIDLGIFGEDDHAEFLEGVVVAMSPQGPVHARIIQWLTEVLIGAKESTQRVRIQLPLTFARSEPEPDVAVIDEARHLGPRHPTSAALIIEVAGRESLRKDRTVKVAVYAEAAVDEYWIIDLAKQVVRVFRDPDPAGREYRTQLVAAVGEVLRPVALPALEVPVAQLFPH